MKSTQINSYNRPERILNTVHEEIFYEPFKRLQVFVTIEIISALKITI